MSLEVFKALKTKYKYASFYGFDPVVNRTKIKNAGLKPLKQLDKSFEKKDLIVITNNHKIFSKMNIVKLSKKLNKPSLIYDFWNHFESKKIKLPINVTYMGLGGNNKLK